MWYKRTLSNLAQAVKGCRNMHSSGDVCMQLTPLCGVAAVGIVPYINASIVLQLLSTAFPALKTLQREEGAQAWAPCMVPDVVDAMSA